MKNSFWRRGTYALTCAMTMFLSISCINGYKEDGGWSSGIENISLESPDAEEITVVPSADGSNLRIGWPVVMGAGGYEFSLYIVDDPANPIVVGEEKQMIDGCSVEREMQEDTYYKVVIKALGNPKYNNKEAESATEKLYNNLLNVTATIPAGTNLNEYFAANPIPNESTELCYELVAGGEYTMNDNIFIGATSVTFRGNKVNHAKISLVNGSFVNAGGGLKLKFIDIDCTGFQGIPAGNAIILMDSNFDDALAASTSKNGYVVIPTTSPVALQSCEIKGLKQYLFYDNNQKYAIGTFLIKDCIIGQNTSSFNAATIRFQRGMVKDMAFTNSTFYNEVVGHDSNRICQISSGHVGNVGPLTETWASGSMAFTNSTFYQFPKGAQSFNSNGAMGQASDRVIVQNCLVVDSGEDGGFIRRLRRGNTCLVFLPAGNSGGFIRRLRRGNTTASFIGGNNSYWYNEKFPSGEVESGRDESGTYVESNPQLVYLGDGKFSLSGSEQIAKRIGDPRWLPAE